MSYFFVYCGAKIEGRIIRNGLDFPAEESYNPNAPGERGKTPLLASGRNDQFGLS